MTYAQFRRMKPKYRRRLIAALVIAFLLFVGLLFGISAGISAIRVLLNTTTLKNVTAQTVLQKDTYAQILEIVKQQDAERLLVLDSTLTLGADGKVRALTLNFVNLPDKTTCEEWRITANEKKATLRKVSTRYENMQALSLRKVRLSGYYPALFRTGSPQLTDYLAQKAPVDAKGYYLFTDNFGNNLSPEYKPYLVQGNTGLWLSKTGALSELNENFKLVSECAPAVVTAHNSESKKKKAQDDTASGAQFIVLLETGPY